MNRRGFFATLAGVVAGTYFSPLAGHTSAEFGFSGLMLLEERPSYFTGYRMHTSDHSFDPDGMVVRWTQVMMVDYPAKGCVLTGISKEE